MITTDNTTKIGKVIYGNLPRSLYNIVLLLFCIIFVSFLWGLQRVAIHTCNCKSVLRTICRTIGGTKGHMSPCAYACSSQSNNAKSHHELTPLLAWFEYPSCKSWVHEVWFSIWLSTCLTSFWACNSSTNSKICHPRSGNLVTWWPVKCSKKKLRSNASGSY